MIVRIGLDLAAVDRFVFDAARAAWFARRIFTDAEAQHAMHKRYPEQHYAGAFAAKEALRKALGRSIAWRDSGIVHDEQGAPQFAFGPQGKAALAAIGDVRVHVSISHTANNAAATVIIERSTA